MVRATVFANGVCRFGVGLLFCASLTCPIAAQETERAPVFDSALLCGQWKFLTGERAGAPASDENLAGSVTISDKEFTLSGNGETFVIAYTVNSKTDPIQVDMHITSGPAPEATALGILKLADNRLTLCYDPMGSGRPDKFESTVSNGWHLFELQKKPFDREALVGDWKYASGERAGEAIAPDRLQGIVTVSKDKFVVPAGPGAEFVMSYTVDDKRFPVGIDLTIESGPAPEGKAVGLIQLDEGKLRFCYDSTGANRPTEFKTSAEDGYFLFTLVKQPKESPKEGDSKTVDESAGKNNKPPK